MAQLTVMELAVMFTTQFHCGVEIMTTRILSQGKSVVHVEVFYSIEYIISLISLINTVFQGLNRLINF